MSAQEQHQAAITIQRHVRGLLTRSHLKQFVHNLKSRKYIANEILSTERTYVKSLDTIVNVFYKPLKQSKIVSEAILKSIFANIDEIHGIHAALIKEMEVTPHLLGTVFAKNIPSFSTYRSYVANYTTSLTKYTAWLEKKAFADCVKGCCSKRPGLQPSDLPGLLNKPVVQLSRYKLLLDDLLSNTNPQNEDFNELQHAVQRLKLVIGGEGNATGATPSSAKSDSSSSSGESIKSGVSMKSNTSSASLARKLNAIAQAPHNLPYKLSPFVSRSVSNTPRATPSPSVYDPGDPSLPSYLRPTHASYARANEGRAKKDQVAYVNNNTPTWMPNGNPHEEKIYNTAYNAIPYTPRQTQVLDRSASGKTWLPNPVTPRSFDGTLVRSASAMSSRDREAPSLSPLSHSTSLSPRKLLDANKTPTKVPLKKQSSATTTPTKAAATPTKTPTATPTKSTTKTPTATPTKTTTATPTKSASTAAPKATTPAKPATPATKAAAAGSHIPVPKTTPGAKTGVAPKTPSQNGFVSKIPVFKAGTPKKAASAPEDTHEDAHDTHDDSNGTHYEEQAEEVEDGEPAEEDDDETMTF